MGKPMGRPSKLTPEVQAVICAMLAEGHFAEHAAERAGIGESTYFQWIERGKRGEVGEDGTNYANFAECCARARAEGEVMQLQRIQDLGEEARDWKAAAWLLERKNPSRYKATSRQEVTGADGGPVQVIAPVIMVPPESDD